MDTAARQLPLVVSVDDHICEPPHLWADRLPSKFQDVAPRVIRGSMLPNGTFVDDANAPDSEPCDSWVFGDLRVPISVGHAAAGIPFEERMRKVDGYDARFAGELTKPLTFEAMRPGAYRAADRLLD